MAKEPEKIKVNGKMYTFRELSEMSGKSVTALRDRHHRGLRDDELIAEERSIPKAKKWDEQIGRKNRLYLEEYCHLVRLLRHITSKMKLCTDDITKDCVERILYIRLNPTTKTL